MNKNKTKKKKHTRRKRKKIRKKKEKNREERGKQYGDLTTNINKRTTFTQLELEFYQQVCLFIFKKQVQN